MVSPKFTDILFQACQDPDMIATFNRECDCHLSVDKLATYMVRLNSLRGNAKWETEMFIDYVANFLFAMPLQTMAQPMPLFLDQDNY